MNRLSPAKRNELILVILGTVTLLALVYVFLISPEQKKIASMGNEIKSAHKQLDDMQASIKGGATIASQFVDCSNRLAQAEQDIAVGDTVAWTFDTIRQFKSKYHLEIPSLGQPSISDVDLMPMTYRQVKLPLSGTGFYHDIGKFVADFENTFPHMRLVNLALEPSPTATAPERLSFRFDVVALVKPGS